MKLQFVFLSLLPFLIQSTKIQAQEEGNFRLMLSGQRTQFSERFVQDIGLGMEYYIDDFLSLSYHFSFGADDDSEFYAHITTGTWLASYPFSVYNNFNDDFWLYLAVLAALIPESVNFHIRASDRFHISPYIAPLGMYYEETVELQNASFDWGFSSGIRFNIFKNNFSFAPYAGIRSTYQRGSKLGVLGGLNLAITF